jgi:hypothetical protein
MSGRRPEGEFRSPKGEGRSISHAAAIEETRIMQTQGQSNTPGNRHTQEELIDEMVEETFPASDATQLPGRAAGAPTHDKVAPPDREPVTPHTIGNQGTQPSSRMLEETVALGDQGEVRLRFDSRHARLHVLLDADGLSLDAAGVDRLIAALSEKRAQME